jgi:hypothetical protein
MKCIYSKCNRTEWPRWKAIEVAKENENLANRIACSEEHFLAWWDEPIV